MEFQSTFVGTFSGSVISEGILKKISKPNPELRVLWVRFKSFGKGGLCGVVLVELRGQSSAEVVPAV